MAGIIHGRVTVASAGTAVRFTTLPTPIKYLLLDVPSANTGSLYVGDSTVASNNTPSIAKGTTRDFTSGMMPKRLPVTSPTFMQMLELTGM